MTEIFPAENRRVAPGECLAVRMWDPSEQKSDPKWIQVAVKEACRHNEISCFDIPDKPRITRNDKHQLAIWLLQEAVRAYDRYLSGWRLYRYHARMDRHERNYYKPCSTKKDILFQLESAWRYYKEWE